MTRPSNTHSAETTPSGGMRVRNPRPGPQEAPRREVALPERRFATVVRGYDRAEVDGYLGDVQRVVAQLRSELSEADERRRRAEQRAESLEHENRAARARAEAPRTPEEGFGVR